MSRDETIKKWKADPEFWASPHFLAGEDKDGKVVYFNLSQAWRLTFPSDELCEISLSSGLVGYFRDKETVELIRDLVSARAPIFG